MFPRVPGDQPQASAPTLRLQLQYHTGQIALKVGKPPTQEDWFRFHYGSVALTNEPNPWLLNDTCRVANTHSRAPEA